mmetsp:Transcript_51377/g.159300  ORF Transcript_51377/g.159300 Transcript_51377/m.159300 type:complete len:279 (+) Transcript_51377:123-959(+)
MAICQGAGRLALCVGADWCAGRRCPGCSRDSRSCSSSVSLGEASRPVGRPRRGDPPGLGSRKTSRRRALRRRGAGCGGLAGRLGKDSPTYIGVNEGDCDTIHSSDLAFVCEEFDKSIGEVDFCTGDQMIFDGSHRELRREHKCSTSVFEGGVDQVNAAAAVGMDEPIGKYGFYKGDQMIRDGRHRDLLGSSSSARVEGEERPLSVMDSVVDALMLLAEPGEWVTMACLRIFVGEDVPGESIVIAIGDWEIVGVLRWNRRYGRVKPLICLDRQVSRQTE